VPWRTRSPAHSSEGRLPVRSRELAGVAATFHHLRVRIRRHRAALGFSRGRRRRVVTSRARRDRLRLFGADRQRLARWAPPCKLDATLSQVAQILVPASGTHCLILPFLSARQADQRRKATRRRLGTLARHWDGSVRPFQVPAGPFTQQANARLGRLMVTRTPRLGYYPHEASSPCPTDDRGRGHLGVASPLYARGERSATISLDLSRITDGRDQHYDLSDGRPHRRDRIAGFLGGVRSAIRQRHDCRGRSGGPPLPSQQVAAADRPRCSTRLEVTLFLLRAAKPLPPGAGVQTQGRRGLDKTSGPLAAAASAW